ncbi:carbohydrate ABC transporter substrate-binding protein, CUT1 family [Natronobacterium texcoconense]|uniref:Carbohydrate ABC transporter substrate-binding protein, CUT1 family n=2 Tax=Natronobacterium texcoconense TaxID=1095778 RepID=A0A1H1H4I6_NATTX|nr:carbohydrate ABC transporter substrate-binding protein, CUT1 family [Natronobacterium texcoconense]
MPMQRRQVLAGIGGLTTMSVAGCLGGSDDQGTTLWHDFTDAEQSDLEDHVAAFNEDRDEELNVEQVPEIVDQLDTAIPSGEGPETFGWAHDWVGTYYDRDFIYDASDDLSIDLEGTFTEAAVQAAQWEGGVYGIPYASEAVTLMYNEDMVDEPPETLDEMVEIMDEYHDPEEGMYGLSCPPADPYFISTFAQAFGGRFFDSETEDTHIDEDDFVEGVELLQNEIWPYVPADPAYEAQIPVFADGNAPFAINGPWEVDGFRDSDIDVTVTSMPDIEGGDPTPYTGIQLWYFTSNLEDAPEEEVETAVEWAEWHATSEDAIVSNAQNHGSIPVHQEYADDDDLGDDVAAFAETVSMGIQMPAHERMDQVWNPVEDALEQVFNDQESAEDAMDAAAEEIRSRWD